MASVSKEPNGHRTVQFIGPDKKRRSVRLGKIGAADARVIADHIGHLAQCWKRRKPPCPQTYDWLAGLLDDSAQHWLYDRLAAVGLAVERARPEDETCNTTVTTLGPFIEAYIKARPKLKPSTITNLEQARRRLVEFFGSDRPMGEITPGDADEFRASLRGKMAENTIRRCCGRAKQFFRAALRKRLIAENPFGDMKGCSVQANKDREFFVDRPMSEKVLAECPDAEWRLLFALSRYGGLRCPSEHLLLTWEDINWESDRFSVHSPKTEHHEGKDSRVVPIFPELRPYLEAVFNQKESQLGRPPSPSDYVISRYRRKNSNLRTELKRIIKRTGLEPWPKLFQNLRASRATELAAEYPAFVAAAWLGHSTDVAKDHYWQVTDADYARAASKPTGNPVQNPVQSMHSGSQSGALERGESVHKNTKKPGKSRVSCEIQAPPVGLEPSLRHWADRGIVLLSRFLEICCDILHCFRVGRLLAFSSPIMSRKCRVFFMGAVCVH